MEMNFKKKVSRGGQYVSPELEMLSISLDSSLMSESFGDGTIDDDWNNIGEY